MHGLLAGRFPRRARPGARARSQMSARARRFCFALALVLLVAPAAAPGESGPGPAAGRFTAIARGTATPPLAGSWRLLPAAPIAPDEGLASVWTGKEMFVFGRVTKRAKDGAVLGRANVAEAYDPARGAWRRLPSAGPTTSFMSESAAWTGTELLVWGQGIREAFNPLTGRWRRLPGSPYLAVHDGFGLVVWTGRELIGWGGGCCGDAFSDGVAYSPTTNTWRNLARAPLAGSQHPTGAWTGRELIVFVGELDPDGNPWPAGLARAAAYDPVTDRWRRIAPLPAPRYGAAAVWDGSEMLVVGGSGAPRANRPPAPARVGFAYDPATNHWRRLPRMESGRIGTVTVWTGKRLLVWGGSKTTGTGPPVIPPHGLAFDPTSNRWSSLPQAPLVGRLDSTAVWTGRALLVWGGQRPAIPLGTGTSFFADGAAFTPASP